MTTLSVLPDGKILVFGSFNQIGSQSRVSVARLFPDGSVDPDFNANSALAIIYSAAVQNDGKIVIGGSFTSFGGATKSNITRLLPNGATDPDFNATTNDQIRTVQIQPDGRILIGGMTRNRVARLLNDPATGELSAPSQSTVRWLRGGSAPEALRVGFELSTDGGTTWQPLASAVRIAGAWEATGLNLPESGQLRARARTSDGKGSTGLVENVVAFSFGPPNQPPVFAGFSAATNYETPVTLFLAKILARASDPDGDALSISAVGPGSEGGSSSLLAQTIAYTPPAGFSGAETLPITLTDARGASTEAFITLNVAEQNASGQGSLATNPPRIQAMPGGKIAISFQGIPGRVYRIERSTDLADWQNLGSFTASQSGLIGFTDNDPPSPTGYYRLAIP